MPDPTVCAQERLYVFATVNGIQIKLLFDQLNA